MSRTTRYRFVEYNYGCFDQVIQSFCPYVGRCNECDDYRERHPRSGRVA